MKRLRPSRLYAPFLLVLLAAPRCLGQTAGVGDAPRPVRSSDPSSPASSKVTCYGFEFQRPYLGYEGPNFTRLDGEPSVGTRYLVKAELFWQTPPETVKFELVDAGGRPIRLLHLSKSDTSPEDGTFVGSAVVPSRPFRVRVSGRGAGGEPYRRPCKRLFRPLNRPPSPSLLPRGLPSAEAKRVREALRELERQTVAAAEEEASKHPDGVIVLPRTEVSDVTYEPFLSARGNVLGMRLKYDVRFSAGGDYAHSVWAFPDYQNDFRGLVDMKVIAEKIEPQPKPPSYATPQIHVDLGSLVRYGSEAWYEAGVVYHFTVDLAPDFVGQNTTKTKFCVAEDFHEYKSKPRRVWEELLASTAPVGYQITLYKAGYAGETGPFHPPRSFYEGHLREGAVKCKPYMNSNF